MLEFDQIQGLVLSGYGHLDHAGYIFLRIDDAAKARHWLAEQVPGVTTARKPVVKPERCMNIALTATGLGALGLPDNTVKTFSAEFREGPAEQNRARIMGDTDLSDPATWDYGGPGTDHFDLLLMLFAEAHAGRDAYREEYRAGFEAAGLTEVCTQNGYRTPDSHEHFGFFDGISQPGIAGAKETTSPEDVQAGEFVFGYMNEYAHLSPVPGGDVLGKNGTYMVFRKLAQDVAALHTFLSSATDGTAEQMDYLGAKMVGRWRSGAPLVLAPDADDPLLGEDMKRNNAFLFAQADPLGIACPVGSHVRRTNPRDSLEPSPPESLKTVRRHAILRRGRSYGSLFDGTNGDHPRGLIFIALNTDIKRQFEFIQGAWINDPQFGGLYDSRDPITAARASGNPHTVVTIPRFPFSREVRGVPQFVTTRGASYFFLPGIAALEYLASLQG